MMRMVLAFGGLFALLCNGVSGDSDFFKVPITPNLVAAGNKLISFQYITAVPNLVDTASNKQLTSFTNADSAGLHMGSPLASMEGGMVFSSVYMDGANPGLLATPPTQHNIVAVPADGSSPAVIIDSSETVSMSPACALAASDQISANSMLYIKGSSIWKYDGATGVVSLQLTADGEISDVTSSPANSSTIAFSILRGTSHSYIALYTLGDNRYYAVSPFADFDDQPAFSPSGERIAWRRRRYQYDCDNVISRVDYRVLSINAREHSTTTPTQLYRGDWYDFDTSGVKKVTFLNEGEVVFPFKADGAAGWLHVGRAGVVAASPATTDTVEVITVDLMAGMECDAFTYSVVDGKGLLFLTHNCDLLESRSLSFYNGSLSPPSSPSPSSSLASEKEASKLVRVFSGTNLFEYGVAGGGGLAFAVLTSEGGGGGGGTPTTTVACVRSSFNTSDVVVVDLENPSDLVAVFPGPALPLASERVPPQLVSFPPSDNAAAPNVTGFLYLPQGPAPAGGWKAVIWTHGGPNTITTVGLTADTYYSFMVGFQSYMASKGVATLALNYRCSTGYGLAFMGLPYAQCPDNSERYDLIGAALYLEGNPLIDSAGGLGVHGLSYGAWNAYSAIAFRPDLFAVGVGVSGVSNRAAQAPFSADKNARAGGRNVLAHSALPASDKLKYGPFPDMNMAGWSGRAESNSDYLFETSPVSQLAQWTVPTLVVCNGDDSEVPVSESIALFHQLQAMGCESEFHLTPESTHAGDTAANFQTIGTLTSDYLLKHLSASSSSGVSSAERHRLAMRARNTEQGVYPFCAVNSDPATAKPAAKER